MRINKRLQEISICWASILFCIDGSIAKVLSIFGGLSSGRPVFLADVGEIRRVVRNNYSGEVVKNTSPKTIAKAVYKVLNVPHVYSKDNCMDFIFEYTLSKVFGRFHEKIRSLYKGV